MGFLWNFLKGIVIGIGAVAPGISGGALAVTMGIYQKLTDAVADVFHDFRNKLKFFLPIGAVIGFGIIGFSKIMKYIFAHYNIEVKYLFIGLMIGTLPAVVKQANKKGFKVMYLVPCLIAFAVTILFTVLESSTVSQVASVTPGIMSLMFYGLIIGFGTIVPGISSSFILIYIGAYETLITSIATIDIAVLIPVGIGFALSIIVFAKMISFLFKYVYGWTFYTILGFVVGSIITIFPGFSLDSKHLIGVLLFVLGIYSSYRLSLKSKD